MDTQQLAQTFLTEIAELRAENTDLRTQLQALAEDYELYKGTTGDVARQFNAVRELVATLAKEARV